MLLRDVKENDRQLELTANKGTRYGTGSRSTYTYFWNTISGLLMAFQSVIMLTILMRVCDLETAGVFTFSYANANLFLNIGKFGVRNYQISDVRRRYGFSDYLHARIFTVALMLLLGSGWALFSGMQIGYSLEKLCIILAMLVFKAVDAIEDVFHGEYQGQGRLDLGATALTVRMVVTIVAYAALIVYTHDLLTSLLIATGLTAMILIVEIRLIYVATGLPLTEGSTFLCEASIRHNTRNSLSMLRDCFPVFIALFLMFYIGNAPKYAIDSYMNDAVQAAYGFISMPVFVVGLLANFIYNPILASLSESWQRGETREFLHRFRVQILLICGITVACLVGAWLIGVPVLSMLYNTDLEPYKFELLILLVGGGFLAAASLFTTGLTLIRRQNRLLVGYMVASLLAFALSPSAVEQGGITGASIIYLALMILVSVWFGAIFTREVRLSEGV